MVTRLKTGGVPRLMPMKYLFLRMLSSPMTVEESAGEKQCFMNQEQEHISMMC